jgi:hypothetical protein
MVDSRSLSGRFTPQQCGRLLCAACERQLLLPRGLLRAEQLHRVPRPRHQVRRPVLHQEQERLRPPGRQPAQRLVAREQLVGRRVRASRPPLVSRDGFPRSESPRPVTAGHSRAGTALGTTGSSTRSPTGCATLTQQHGEDNRRATSVEGRMLAVGGRFQLRADRRGCTAPSGRVRPRRAGIREEFPLAGSAVHVTGPLGRVP